MILTTLLRGLGARALLAAALSLTPAATLAVWAGQPAVATDRAASIPDARRAAWAVERVTLLDLRLSEFPDESDYVVADTLLAIAQKLDPGQAGLVRKRIEANWNAGRGEAATALTGELIRLDPADTVAQLRFISETIGRRQTVAERLALYAKFTASRTIDPSVRSRLATDAALLCRESDDTAAFRDYLRLATTLDSTNKEAAILALEMFAHERPDDAAGQCELMSNLLMADPLDPMVYLSLAGLLADHGCFEQANRMHTNARALLRRTGGRITDEHEVEALVLEWQVEGPAKVLARISSNLAKQRADVERYNEEAAKGIGLANDIGKSEDVRLTVDTEKVRLSTAIASDDAEAAAASLKDLTRSCDFKMTLATDEAKRPVGVSREAAMTDAQAAQLDLQYWRVMAGLDLDKVDDALASYERVVEAGLPGPAIVRAILKVRQGDFAGGLAALDALLTKLPERQLVRYTVEYARALAFDGLGRKDEAVESYRIVARGAPLRPVGAIARFRLEKALGKHDEFSPQRPALDRIAKGIPKFVDDMIEQPKSFMSLLGDAPSKGAFGDDAPVSITVRNISPIPLAIGSDRTINSRIMLSPTLGGLASRLAHLSRPEIVELDQRLRLDPRETLRIEVHPDLGYPGFVLDLGCDAQARYSWRIIQGFAPARTGNFIPGPLSLAAESSAITKPPIAESKLPAADLAQKLAKDEGDALYRDLLAARQRLWAELLIEDFKKDEPKPAAKPNTPSPAAKPADGAKPADPAKAADPAKPAAKPEHVQDARIRSAPPGAKPSAAEAAAAEAKKPKVDHAAERTVLADAMLARYAAMSATQRLLVAAMMPHAGQVAEMAGLDAAILADADPDVHALALVTRISDKDAKAITDAAASADPRLKELGTRLQTRLGRPGPTYSRLTGGLRNLRGQTETPDE